MTIEGWIVFTIFAVFMVFVGILAALMVDSIPLRIAAIVLAMAIVVAALFGGLWYFRNTASGQREIVDQKSNLGNGMDRTVTIYTANGDVLATYSGRIDIDTNDGGYIKFDFDGKRYIYYNCFVETIAEINQ